jgi:hypothetical protein
MHLFFRKMTSVSIPIVALSVGAAPASAALSLVAIFNNVDYQQTSTAAPTTSSSSFFTLGGNFQNAGDFDSASASYPGPASQPMAISGTGFGFESSLFGTQALLHAAYPFGNYSQTASNSVTKTSQTGVINYTVDRFAASIPALTPGTYNAIQNYNPSTALTAFFNSYTANPGVSANNSFIFFTIFDNSTFNTVYSDGFLSNTATNVTIPANTLLPNRAYGLEIDFSGRLNGTDAVNNVPTLQGFDVRTDINFTTVAPEPATLAAMMPALLLLRVSRKSRHANPRRE